MTKSGTNEFHGNLFEFVRNGMFNARNAFATKRDTIKRNQFGGTIGGPIMKNKLFFFGGYQGTTIRQDPADSLAFVPTAAMLAGDLYSLRFARMQCRPADHVESAVRQQSDRSRSVQQSRRGLRKAAAEIGRSVRQNHLQQSRATSTIQWPSAGSTTRRATIIRFSAGIWSRATTFRLPTT